MACHWCQHSPGERSAADHRAEEWHLAEALLPGLSTPAATELVQHLQRATVSVRGQEVALAGSLLIPDDEVLLCLLRGRGALIRAACDRSGLPAERIVRCVRLG